MTEISKTPNEHGALYLRAWRKPWNRTFLLCVDTNLVFVLFPLFEATGDGWPNHSVGAMFATMKTKKREQLLPPHRAFLECSPELLSNRLQSTSMRRKRSPGWRTFTK